MRFVDKSTHAGFTDREDLSLKGFQTCWGRWAEKPMGFLSESVVTRLRTASAGTNEPVTKHFVLGELTVIADVLDALGQGSYVVQAGPWDHIVPHDHTHAEFLAFF